MNNCHENYDIHRVLKYGLAAFSFWGFNGRNG